MDQALPFLLLLPVPVALYVLARYFGRGAWGLVPGTPMLQGVGAYRAAAQSVWVRGKAPMAVRVAAISSFVLGQMLFPGALAALAGLVAMMDMLGRSKFSPGLLFLTLSAPTGLIVAGKLLGTGVAMLKRDADAAISARRTAAWALWHNAALMVAMACAALAEKDGLWFLLPGIYAAISVAQALLLRHAASALEAYDRLQADAPPPVESPPTPA
jgi:hypothetical protein